MLSGNAGRIAPGKAISDHFHQGAPGAAYDRARNEFENGTGDILTVLASQQQEFTARSQLLTVRRLRLETRIDLYLALGGSFRPYEPPPAEKEVDS